MTEPEKGSQDVTKTEDGDNTKGGASDDVSPPLITLEPPAGMFFLN